MIGRAVAALIVHGLARCAAVLALCLAIAAPAAAQNALALAVKVDDEIITNFDVDQRARLLALETRSKDRGALTARAREELIDETLKQKEAARRGVNVPEEAVNAALEQLAKRNGASIEAFLKQLTSAGVERSSFERRLRASIAWNEMLRKHHLRKIQPNEGEIASEIESTTKSGPDIYDVKQIVVDLPPSARGAPVEQALRRALGAREQLTNCDALRRLAPKYSKISGDVGRITAKQMPPPVRKAVLQLKIGQTTKPMRSQNGWHVIMLCGVEKGGRALTAEEAKSRLAAKKADNVSRSLVSDLRRDALIEVLQ